MTALEGFDGPDRKNPAEGQIEDVTTANFRETVIAASAEKPVLVDFWAPWCGPCKQLAPALEKIAKAAGDKIKLVKMNIDEHPQIAGQLGIKSIPAVIAFQRGQPVDGFMGALPEGQIRGFVERLTGPLTDDSADALAEATEALEVGQTEQALAMFQEVLTRDPENAPAMAGLLKSMVQAGEIERARELVDALADEFVKDPAISAAVASLELAEQAGDLGDLAELHKRVDTDPSDFDARFDLAIALNAKGEREKAADLLLEIIRKDRSWRDDGAREQLVQFFDAWGPTDPNTVAARRKLSTSLFS